MIANNDDGKAPKKANKRKGFYLPSRLAEFDLPSPAPKITSKLLFATTPRCGSHFVCSTLYQTQRVGLPLEYFNPAHWDSWRKQSADGSHWGTLSYLVAQRTGGNGVFSTKFHWSHFEALRSVKMQHWFQGAHWVKIERADIVGQAVSWEIAGQTGSFIYTQAAWKSPVYSFEGIFGRMVNILTQQEAWRCFFASHDIRYHTVVLEHFLQDPQEAVETLLKRLDLPPAKGPKFPEIPVVESQRREINDEWKARLVADLGEKGMMLQGD
jgi:LPS sulfotransferase NodH